MSFRWVYDEFPHHIFCPKSSKVQFTTTVVSTVIVLLSLILESIDEIFICVLQGIFS
ncbi:hypothetical protein ASNER_019 [Candidatus Uzinura diaspidicola str. ASNER]|uniref:Preprotein translocase subunit SecE n=1 Tax=Candidatus Uzinura diaspidicola str. ASNER TaxID=1133592 RepID=L7VK14_9FLAO|nr:hypothetical protein ASNER_019 [Candidatus Uzinura diaspidicola str. ASNER]